MLKFARDMYETTDGAVNVALGAVLKIWHDYRGAGLNDPENAELPPKEELLEAARHTDIHDIVIDEEASTVFLKDRTCALTSAPWPRDMPPSRSHRF